MKFRFNDSTGEIHVLGKDQMGGEQYDYVGTYVQFDLDYCDTQNEKTEKVERQIMENG